ncbi:MAG: hypothetical protein JNL74_05235 [Fibrobacteres bacterium]|nr:hypothetical protein [Fibrobacterota bacterium]
MSYTGLSITDPLKTLNRAYKLIQNDIIAANGNYTSTYAQEPYVISIMSAQNDFGLVTLDYLMPDGKTVNFSSDNNLTIKSYEQAYDKRAVIYTAGTSVNLFNIKVLNVKFDGIKFFGGPNVSSAIVPGAFFPNIEFVNCVFAFEVLYNGINCKISSTAIDGKNGSGPIFQDITVQNSIFIGSSAKTGTAITLGDGDLYLANNLFYRLGTVAKVTDRQFPVQSDIRNCIFLSCTKGLDLAAPATGIFNVYNSLSYNYGTAGSFAVTNAAVTLTYRDTLLRDPKLTDADPLSLTVGALSSSTPCVDMGLNGSIVPSTDFNAAVRQNPDIGPIEVNGNTPSSVPAVIFVNPDYTGSVKNGQQATPFISIQAAYDAIPGGLATKPYIISLVKGASATYNSGLVMTDLKNFTPENPLTIRSFDVNNRVTFRMAGTIFNLLYTKNVIIDAVCFEGSTAALNRGVVGGYNATLGRAENVTIRKCRFTSVYSSARLQPISGLGDGLLVENSIFVMDYGALTTLDAAYPAIEQGTNGGSKYKIYNNTALNDWSSFVKMTTNVNVECVNNLVMGTLSLGTVKTGTTLFLLNQNNYCYKLAADAAGNVLGVVADPLIVVTPTTYDFANPQYGSPLIDAGYASYGMPRDDYYDRFDGEGKRDIGAVEYYAYSPVDAAFYSLNQSGNVIAEMDRLGRVKFANIYASGMVGKEVFTAQGVYAKSLYYITNHLGSTMKIVDQAGNTADQIQYFSYGDKQEYANGNMAGIDATETFTGKALDKTGQSQYLGIDGKGMGLYYFGARYYDPELGQWNSQDPDEQFVTPYAYAGNNFNPISYCDNDGYFLKDFTTRIRDYGINTEQEAIDAGWRKLPYSESRLHEFGPSSHFSKYISPDGHGELVFDENGNLVTYPLITGTYNYYDAQKHPVGHLFNDVLPWILFGTGDDDPSDPVDRLGMSLFGSDWYYKHSDLQKQMDLYFMGYERSYSFVVNSYGTQNFTAGFYRTSPYANPTDAPIYQEVSVSGKDVTRSSGGTPTIDKRNSGNSGGSGGTTKFPTLNTKPQRSIPQNKPQQKNSPCVICTELHRQGYLTGEIYLADQKYGVWLKEHDIVVFQGYYFWARYVVKLMQEKNFIGRSVTRVVRFFAEPWAKEMAHEFTGSGKGSLFGKIIFKCGYPMCRIIGTAFTHECISVHNNRGLIDEKKIMSSNLTFSK